MRARAVAALLVLTVAVACRGPGPPPPAPPPADAFAERVETREVQLDDDFITVRLHIPPTGEPRKPTVIVAVGDRSRLLRQGLLVVTYRINWDLHKPPAPPPPANSVGTWVLSSPSPDVLGREYLRSISGTAAAIPKIVDFLQTVPEIDPARLGITGSSTHGFIALQAVARDRRLVAAVVLAACGDYHHFLRYSSMGIDGQPLALAPDYDRWLRAQEVIRHPQRVVHAAVLMINRNGDPIVPFGCADRTAAVLARAYRRAGIPDRFRFSVVESDRHGVDLRDAEEMLAWLDRWLRTPPGSAPRRRHRRAS